MLDNSQIKVIVNIVILVVIALGSFFYLRSLNIKEKGYRYLFVVYIVSWISPMLLRSYSGTMQNLINIDYTWIVLASYGIVGIFSRTFADYINFKFKSRKTFLYLSAIIQLAMYIPIIIAPSTTASIIQSIGVGIGASCIGSFQLLFKEQYSKKKAFLTVSILSIPPIIADLLTAPLQSIVMSIANEEKTTNPDILKYLWVIGIIFTTLSFIMIFFVKEEKKFFNSSKTNEFIFKKDGSEFIILCFLGMLITFIKFSNSGSVGTLHLQTLGKLSGNDTSGYEGYLSVIFSISQLIGSVMIGSFLVRRFTNSVVFLIGSTAWLTYSMSVMFVTNPIAYFLLHSLNGFAYGILYNFILGTVLSSSFKTSKITPMGIYQSLLACGIALSTGFTQFIRNNLKINYYYANIIIDSIIVSVILVMVITYILYEKKLKKNNIFKKDKQLNSKFDQD
ncbi:MAG: hypothetical protein ACRC4L_00685 [Mycoplasma sp.]